MHTVPVKKSLRIRLKNIWNLRENVYKICPTKHGVQRCPTKFNMAMQNGRPSSPLEEKNSVRREIKMDAIQCFHSTHYFSFTIFIMNCPDLLRTNILKSLYRAYHHYPIDITHTTERGSPMQCNMPSPRRRISDRIFGVVFCLFQDAGWCCFPSSGVISQSTLTWGDGSYSGQTHK